MNNKIEFSVRIGQNSPQAATGVITEITTQVISITGQLRRLAETGCNYGLSEKQGVRQGRLEQKLEALARELGLGVTIQSDPRGRIAYLTFPDGGEWTIPA